MSFPHRIHLLLVAASLVLTACANPKPAQITGVIGMTLGGGHTCATVFDNGMRCWGDNLSGQLGNGTNAAASPTPVEPTGWGSGPSGVGGGATILDFAAGDAHTCINATGGRLFCWGSNAFGQLGVDSNVDANIAQPVRQVIAGGAPLQATFVVAGDHHTCALYSPGSVACWGRFYDKKPQAIPGLTNPQRIAAGGDQTCVLEAGGMVKCWRMLATGTPSPAVVSGVTAKAIAVGRLHACAIDPSDAVVCWGSNTLGQLGNGNRSPTAGAVTVLRSGAFVAAVEVAAGRDHTCALLASGAVECWGSNANGQTGDPGTSGFTLTAFPVIPSGAGRVAAGAGHSCARVDGGSVRRMQCWGSNADRQLGNPAAGQFSVTPVPVVGLP